MKKIFFLAVACLMGVTAAHAQQADSTIKFTTTVHDFGEVEQNVPPTYTFEFTNTGKEPIVIQTVSASCGCTTPGWTKEPVAPGQKGEVKATFNAATMGFFSKTLTVVSNGNPSPIVLHIKGTVVAKKAEEPKKS